MSGFKLLNLNTADPWIIQRIIGDYLSREDYVTLKNIGLTQSAINHLKDGKPFYNPYPLYSGELITDDLIISGKINPPHDLDIPGDLYKITFITPDNPLYSSGIAAGRRTWKNLGPFDGRQREVTGLEGENADLSQNYVNPLLTNFETSPSANRLLSLWNAYGGDRSVIMTKIIGCGSFPDFFVYRGGGSNFGEFPELAGYPFGVLPFGNYGVSNFYFKFITQELCFNGIYSGFDYDKMRSIWNEGRAPYSRGDINPATGTNYGVNEVIHGWGEPGKIQVPSYLRRFIGGRDERRLTYILRYEFTESVYLQTDIISSFDSPYRTDGLFRSIGNGVTTKETGIALQLPSGQIVEEPGFSGEHIPWIEWPEVWDGSVYRPWKSPIGRFYLDGDRESYIEFMKEVSEHFIAMREWFDAGCPCDWEDWGGYVDPTVEAEQAWQEKVNISFGNKYIPAVTSAEQPPKNPILGDLWRDTVSGSTKVFTQINETTRGWVDQ